MSSVTNLLDLPNEILETIIGRLRLRDILCVVLTNRRLNKLGARVVQNKTGGAHLKTLVIALSDSTIRILPLNKQKPTIKLRGYTGTINALAVSHNNRFVVSAGSDGVVRTWRLDTGVCLRKMFGHTQAIFQLWITEDDQRIYSAALDRTIRIWRVDSGASLGTVMVNELLPSLGFRLTSREQRLIIGTWSGELLVYTNTLGKPRPSFSQSRYIASLSKCFTISPDDRYVIVGDELGHLSVFDLESGEQLRSFTNITSYQEIIKQVTFTSIDINGTMTRCIIVSTSDMFALLDFNTGQLLHKFSVHRSSVDSFFVVDKCMVSYSGDDGRGIILWTIEGEETMRQISFDGKTMLTFTVT